MSAVIVSYGGGTNSAAMLVGLHERGITVNHIVFCDTGSEKPHTYEHIVEVSLWCELVGFPPIMTIRGTQPRQVLDGSLEAECIRLGTLPSKAMGFGSCSQKWKVDPFRKWLRSQAFSELPTRMVGFDADEINRMDRAESYADPDCIRRYPLIEWGWGREECVAAISRAGMSQPGKSACFFCPSSKKHELLQLRQRYPELMQRAISMERRALAGEGQAPAFRGKGLGRYFSWEQFLADYDAEEATPRFKQIPIFDEAGAVEIDCACFDGE